MYTSVTHFDSLSSHGLWCPRKEPKEILRFMFSMCQVTSIIIPVWISSNIILSCHGSLTMKLKNFSHWNPGFCKKLSTVWDHYNFFVHMHLHQKPSWKAYLQEKVSNRFVISVNIFKKYLLPRFDLKLKSVWQKSNYEIWGHNLGIPGIDKISPSLLSCNIAYQPIPFPLCSPVWWILNTWNSDYSSLICRWS